MRPTSTTIRTLRNTTQNKTANKAGLSCSAAPATKKGVKLRRENPVSRGRSRNTCPKAIRSLVIIMCETPTFICHSGQRQIGECANAAALRAGVDMQPHVFPFVPDPNQRKFHHARKETAEQLDVSLPGDNMLLAGLRSGGGGCCATMGRSSREGHADLCLSADE